MPRPIDPERYEARRQHIIDAALTRFAADGFHGTSTASICRTAGIGSGTFFHYFPTKSDVLIAILELGTAEVREFFTSQHGRTDARQVLFDYLGHALDDLRDERAAGFTRAVGAQISDERVAKALAVHQDTVRTGLRYWVTRARDECTIRTDLSARSLTTWLMLLIEGFAVAVADFDSFDPRQEQHVLIDTVARFLGPQ
ncbi:TetR/AcrR family transcriptional regulator [Nocardia iowensis]|uniref:TetR/AcrR family transcriptional regulator n=1 Tax=Nocardia iowensis TaxID=204891 RepID=A0ABX8RIJ5_NOCIO|nr:TetR/AcrR family transcriptional regulator [Nocardia iowensis]QXN88729.1 TetR/AcrR family transcriptional regulator [Nocardia iowensis]